MSWKKQKNKQKAENENSLFAFFWWTPRLIHEVEERVEVDRIELPIIRTENTRGFGIIWNYCTMKYVLCFWHIPIVSRAAGCGKQKQFHHFLCPCHTSSAGTTACDSESKLNQTWHLLFMNRLSSNLIFRKTTQTHRQIYILTSSVATYGPGRCTPATVVVSCTASYTCFPCSAAHWSTSLWNNIQVTAISAHPQTTRLDSLR